MRASFQALELCCSKFEFDFWPLIFADMFGEFELFDFNARKLYSESRNLDSDDCSLYCVVRKLYKIGWAVPEDTDIRHFLTLILFVRFSIDEVIAHLFALLSLRAVLGSRSMMVYGDCACAMFRLCA